ncbi:hypothetical protein LCGC14_3136250 [marine sediment metagenome]|uniref:ATP-cone domain-containing protein n=1 Tax=marine sediment metagenome TaxID=412755 RepID=A0A0F8YMJ2_9ZZZZ
MASETKHGNSGYKRFLPLVYTKKGKVEFDPRCIYRSLLRETDISEEGALSVTKKVTRVLIKINLSIITAPLIREVVNVQLLKMGLERIRLQYTRLGMPKYDIKRLKEEYHDINEILRRIGEWTLWEYEAVDDLIDKKKSCKQLQVNKDK